MATKMKLVKPTHMYAKVKDKHGNAIIRKGGTIFLILAGEDRQRNIGFIDFDLGIFFTKRTPMNHLHRKSNSYGFNEQIIKGATTFSHVNVAIAGKNYKIPNEDILEHGKHLFFKQQGFELQLFVSMDIIENYKI